METIAVIYVAEMDEEISLTPRLVCCSWVINGTTVQIGLGLIRGIHVQTGSTREGIATGV